MTGIVVKGIGGFYYVKNPTGEITECRARGLFRKEGIKPMIGDRVTVCDGSLISIEERKNALIRPPVANIDNLVIVSAAASPDPDFLLIDKMLVNAEAAGINAFICVNKTDLAASEKIKETYSLAGYSVIEVCAKENEGIGKLKELLKDKTTAFAGLSGVGKSSILNLITGGSMETGDVSKINRGRHTTRHVELMELDGGGFVLDTPGFSSFELEGITALELCGFFPEFSTDKDCRFKGCVHINEPDCAVKNKLSRGEIAKSRYDSYCQLYEALKKIKEWENK